VAQICGDTFDGRTGNLAGSTSSSGHTWTGGTPNYTLGSNVCTGSAGQSYCYLSGVPASADYEASCRTTGNGPHGILIRRATSGTSFEGVQINLGAFGNNLVLFDNGSALVTLDVTSVFSTLTTGAILTISATGTTASAYAQRTSDNQYLTSGLTWTATRTACMSATCSTTIVGRGAFLCFGSGCTFDDFSVDEAGGSGVIGGSSSGSATTSGAITGSGAIAGSSSGSATTSGTLRPGISGSSSGVATTSGAVTGIGAIAGSASGVATTSGSLLGAPVNIMWTGHSEIWDPVAEYTDDLLTDMGVVTDWEKQSIDNSTMATRQGAPTAYTGLQTGTNKAGSNRDILADLQSGTYNHIIFLEQYLTATHVVADDTVPRSRLWVDIARQGVPAAQGWLYGVWYEIDSKASPSGWIAYELAQVQFHNAICKRIKDATGDDRVRPLPVNGALATLCNSATTGSVPGITGANNTATMNVLFTDNVHLTDVGKYYVACFVSAVLTGSSPVGRAYPVTVTGTQAASLQAEAWAYRNTYYSGSADGPAMDNAARIAFTNGTWLTDYATRTGENEASLRAVLEPDNSGNPLSVNSGSIWLALPAFSGPISGSSAGAATTSATVTGQGAIAGSSSGVASTSGASTGSGAIAGSSQGSATTSGAATGSGAVAGSSAGTATTSGTATGAGSVAGAAQGQATTAGTVGGSGAVAGSAQGSATTSAGVFSQDSLSGSAQGSATTSGTVGGSGAVAGSAAGSAATSGEVGSPVAAAGSASGAGSASATVGGSGAVAGSAQGSATTSGALESAEPGAIAGSAQGSATTSGTVTGIGAIGGSSQGSATTSGGQEGPIAGSSQGRAKTKARVAATNLAAAQDAIRRAVALATDIPLASVYWDGQVAEGVYHKGARCELSLKTFEGTGQDERRAATTGGVRTIAYVGNRRLVISVRVEVDNQILGANAWLYLGRLRSRLQRPAVRAILKAQKVAVTDYLPGITRDATIQQRRVSIGIVDLVMHAAEIDVDPTYSYGWIETASGTAPNETDNDLTGHRFSA
jgi:hypothetical protein